MKDLKNIINILREQNKITHRQVINFSFGNVNTCKQYIKQIFLMTDQTITEFNELPEYEEVAKYLSNNNGKGLFLSGSVGRGKSLIIENVIPALLFSKGKVVNKYHSTELGANLSEIMNKKFIAIDDVGVEGIYHEYGNEMEAFAEVVTYAERYNKMLFISTNLNFKQFVERYGVRIIDRLKRLCHFIKFEGDSLRK